MHTRRSYSKSIDLLDVLLQGTAFLLHCFLQFGFFFGYLFECNNKKSDVYVAIIIVNDL